MSFVDQKALERELVNSSSSHIVQIRKLGLGD